MTNRSSHGKIPGYRRRLRGLSPRQRPTGRPYVGGYAIASPMGDIIASNITPAKGTGIGDYSEPQFRRALTQGIRRDGQPLYPAMPYTAYQGLSDDDLHALYRYFMAGVAPVDRAVPETQLTFPFSWRYAIHGWNWLFLKKRPSMKTGRRRVVAIWWMCWGIARRVTAHVMG